MNVMNLTKSKTKTTLTETQRIAKVLGINYTNIDDIHLCVIVQDKIKELQNRNKKLEFVNSMVKKANSCKNTYLDSYGQQIEDLKFVDELNKGKDKVYAKLRKENEEKDFMIENLKSELKYYEEKLKINRI